MHKFSMGLCGRQEDPYSSVDLIGIRLGTPSPDCSHRLYWSSQENYLTYLKLVKLGSETY